MFFWGVSTSSFQIEEDCINSNWIHLHPKYKQSTRHCHFVQDDIELLKNLNVNSYRFSIEWSKINPEPFVFLIKPLEFYQNLINDLIKFKITPIVCLFHFSMPLWFQNIGGFEDEKNIEHFIRYVAFIKSNLSNVEWWILMNEPNVFAFTSYLMGIWPPYKKSIWTFLRVTKNLRLACERVYSLFSKDLDKVGITINMIDFHGSSFIFYPFIYIWDLFFNTMPVLDFIGVNYYFSYAFTWKDLYYVNDHFFDRFIGLPNHSDMGWPIEPKGLYRVLEKCFLKFKISIIITENGIADKNDTKRRHYLSEHLNVVHNILKEKKIELIGYFYWSLLDNIEWEYGIDPRFGLVEVEYNNDFKRKIRESYYFYQEWIRNFNI